jgi:predicted ferric reductase
MSDKRVVEATVLPLWLRYVLGGMLVSFVLLVLAGGVSVPFVFETQSIRYKSGFDKTLLRTGQIIGMTAATLLLWQLILSARFKILDHIFSLNKLYIFHRINGVTIAVLAVLHPLCVFAPEDIANIPLELKFWPEILGASLLLSIWTITATGIWRRFLGLQFHLWWLAHRAATFMVAVILFVHVLYVSDAFTSGLPRFVILLVAGIYGLIFCWVKLKPFLHKRKAYTITNITKTAQNTYSVEVAPQQGNIYQYLPGQFAFVSFQSEHLSPEEHPFTMSSSPTRPEYIQFSIHCSGDWTRNISHLKTGDNAVLDGPYGQFSHVVHANQKEIIMVAGGIGITPMLSMLRYLADADDYRLITLVWSNRTEADRVFADEFEALAQQLKGLRIFHVDTRSKHVKKSSTRLDKEKLQELLKGCDRGAAIFICGPPLMMQDVRRILLQIGFLRRLIYVEKFAL